ncbi:MAG: hypothetical protein AAFQ53_13235, partial [Bacteroidota bacterium]
ERLERTELLRIGSRDKAEQDGDEQGDEGTKTQHGWRWTTEQHVGATLNLRRFSRALASEIYLYRFTSGSFTTTRRLTIVR